MVTRAAGPTRREVRYRAIMDSLFIHVGMLDPAGTVIEMNAAALDSAGLTAADVVGLPLPATYWWSWDAVVQAQLEEALRRAGNGQASRYDAEIRLGENRRTVIDLQIVPVADDGGELLNIVVSGLDVSDRKDFERELGRLAGVEARQRRQAEDLLTLARALSSSVDPDAIFDTLNRLGPAIVGADFAHVALVDKDGTEVELRHGPNVGPDLVGRWESVPLDESTPAGSCLLSGSPLHLGRADEVAGRFPALADDLQRAGFEALAAVPVGSTRRVAIGFAWTEPTDFDPSLTNALEIVAQLADQALERAELYEREHRVATRLQRELLPQALPEIPGADLATRYEAGAAGLDVGGDWFDVVSGSADRWLLAVGDLVGSGLSAAAAMGSVRNAFTALATGSDDVDSLLVQLDKFVHDLEDARLSTISVAEYHCADGTVRVGSAGHLPPLVRRRDGSVSRLECAAPPLGFELGLERESLIDRLDPGDCLLMYTDGLVERQDESIDDSIDRLASAFARQEPQTAAALCEALLGEVAPGGDDDMALLALVVGSHWDNGV